MEEFKIAPKTLETRALHRCMVENCVEDLLCHLVPVAFRHFQYAIIRLKRRLVVP